MVNRGRDGEDRNQSVMPAKAGIQRLRAMGRKGAELPSARARRWWIAGTMGEDRNQSVMPAKAGIQ